MSSVEPKIAMWMGRPIGELTSAELQIALEQMNSLYQSEKENANKYRKLWIEGGMK